MKHIPIISILLIMSSSLFAQTPKHLSLNECQQKAHANYPLIKQYDLVAKSEKFTLDNVAKSYLPQVSFNAQATCQTDVTQLPISIPIPGVDIPKMDKDQYKATIDVSQLIWDGGATSAQQKITKANSEVERSKIEVSLYAIKETVNQLYFGILATDEQLNILKSLETDLQTNYNIAASMLANGVIMQSDIDIIKVEILNLAQQRIGQIELRNAYLKMLSLFINTDLLEATSLEKPSPTIVSAGSINRPELSLYEKQRALFDAQSASVVAKNSPRFSLFAQGGYGKPGLNMLESKFDFYGIGGIKLNWNFGNLYTKKNERRLIRNNQYLVDIQEETFRFNTNLQLSQSQIEMRKYKKLLQSDDEIIELRHRVKTASESKYKNGVYQMNELVRDITAANQSSLMKALHEIQYLMTIYNYKYIQGAEL